MSIVSLRHIWFGLGAAMVAGSLIALFVFGIRWGIDFTGGSLSEVTLESFVTSADVRTTLEAAGYTNLQVQETGSTGQLIRTTHLSEEAHQAMLATLRSSYGGVEELRFDSIGPMIGQELKKTATWGVILTLTLIGTYIALAFRKVSRPVASWKYGLLTIACAFHDVIVMVGVYIVVGFFLGWEMNATFVAASLTVLGYSINDTVVVFDRIRENLANRVGKDFEDTVDMSIRQTLARSLNTSLTTILAITAVLIFGGDTTRPFAFALMVGIAAGSYSSIFLASPALVAWEAAKKKNL
jgi:preprotein translocase subunit SecF